MKWDKYQIVAIIYFFFNGLFLPSGLQYTMLLAPFLYWWILKNGGRQIATKFLMIAVPYTVIHLFYGANIYYNIRSLVMVFAVYVFIYAFHVFVKKKRIQDYFPTILMINFIFFVLAVILLFTPLKELVWTIRNLTQEILDFPRLELFTYEPSYYSLLLAPLAIYYILKVLLRPTHKIQLWAIIFSILLPLVFSFSLGVLACLFLSFLLLVTFNFKVLLRKKKLFYPIASLFVLMVSAFLVLLIFFPDNPLFERLGDISAGKDISAQGRTQFALVLAYQIAEKVNLLFGVGLGQIKVVGLDIIVNFYKYSGEDALLIRIPNAVGETLAMFGLSGLMIRLGLQIYLFFKTKVFSNYYRLTVFIFIFIYQFTGSFFSNSAELVMWVIAFTPCCFEFERSNFLKA